MSQQAQINELKIGQRNMMLIGGVVLFGVFVLIVILLSQRRSFKYRQAVTEIEHKVLRLQMNPHFIFNALGSIQNYMLKNEGKAAGLYLTKFSKLMRQTLEFSRKELITLAEEITLLENYIEIQRLSSGQKFEYEIVVDEALDKEEIRIPPMLAQPFVENSIEHGNLGNYENGHLRVCFSRSNEELLLTVDDNGNGVNSQGNDKNHNSLATKITNERLRLLEMKFKVSLGLTLSNISEGIERKGTRVAVSLPLIHGA